MKTKNTEELFQDLEAFDTAMLVTRDGRHLRSRPMQVYVHASDGTIRFLTSIKTHKTVELKDNPDANIVFTDDNESWISVSGQIRLSRESADIDELWSSTAEAWLKHGRDEAVVLVLEPEIAEYWDRSENAVRAAWEMAKSQVTGDKPDLGENRKVVL